MLNLIENEPQQIKGEERKSKEIRKSFPRVIKYWWSDDREYFLVDCRSKKMGLTTRKNFNNETDAIEYARQVEKDWLNQRGNISSNLIYQSKDIERFDNMLKPLGKTLEDAVIHLLRFHEEEVKKSIIPPIKDLCLKWYVSKRDSKIKPLGKRSKNDLKMYWKFITRIWGEHRPDEVSREMIEKVIENVGGSESNVTRKHYLKFVRTFFIWCVKQRFIRDNPTDGIEVRIKRKAIAIYTPEEIERLLDLCEAKYPSLLGYCCLSVFAGLRPTEAQNVKWADLNFETKEIYADGKTGPRRFVLKNTDTIWQWLEHFKKQNPDQPLNPSKNHENLQKKLRREFGHWIRNGLRHSFGTYYHNLTKNLPEVVFAMGNSVEVAKRHYVREVMIQQQQKFWSLSPKP